MLGKSEDKNMIKTKSAIEGITGFMAIFEVDTVSHCKVEFHVYSEGYHDTNACGQLLVKYNAVTFKAHAKVVHFVRTLLLYLVGLQCVFLRMKISPPPKKNSIV